MGYAPEVAFALARDLEKYNLEYFEQPMPFSCIGESARLRTSDARRRSRSTNR